MRKRIKLVGEKFLFLHLGAALAGVAIMARQRSLLRGRPGAVLLLPLLLGVVSRRRHEVERAARAVLRAQRLQFGPPVDDSKPSVEHDPFVAALACDLPDR